MEGGLHLPGLAELLRRCVSIDLEVDPSAAKIFAFAGVRQASDRSIAFRSPKSAQDNSLALNSAIDALEEFVAPDDFLIGHNILRFDLPQLIAVRPKLSGLTDRVIDTLWLNPLAFPKNPYHRLVKHYQDGRLLAGQLNDPERDARLVFEVLGNQITALSAMDQSHPDVLIAYHFLSTLGEAQAGFDAVFTHIRKAARPDQPRARDAVRKLLVGAACSLKVEQLNDRLSEPSRGWPTAYALSWISVAGGESVMPPWVRIQFPEAARIVRDLRDTRCGSSSCSWCAEKNDPKRALKNWFGFDAFRPEPKDAEGVPLQERIVAEAMQGQSVLGILPTGTGKSVCYQVPALSKYEKTGALTVVISPLVALMADQVRGLAEAGVSGCFTINGMLSLPERQAALEAVRLGDAAILLIAPEQLRTPSVRSVLRQREIGYWVIDEAHCISKWGHDFRPDYRYVSRFIGEFSGDEPPAPVISLTATAKPEVVQDIRSHFKTKIDVDLAVLDGGSVRTNLSFRVERTTKATKYADVLQTLKSDLPQEGRSGAIVYCSTRTGTERMADFLKAQSLEAECFHAGLTPETKRDIQERFRSGSLRIIAATNAFGMGIDKPDIRLVIHSDVPGSLENYMQEAGRAGRDRLPATCVLLYAEEDVERQFSLSARSRLEKHEIAALLKAIRRLDQRFQNEGEVVATPGEIIKEEGDREFMRDSATDDTRVKTAIAWLEEAGLLTREHNRTHVYPSSLKIRSVDEARAIIADAKLTERRRAQLLSIVGHLVDAEPDAGVSTDELSSVSGLPASELRKALIDLETLGIATNDTALTAYVTVGVAETSIQKFQQALQLEKDFIQEMEEVGADDTDGTKLTLHISGVCQRLRDQGYAFVRPDVLQRMLKSIAEDGRDDSGGQGSLRLRKPNRSTITLELQRSWRAIREIADLRRRGAELILSALIGAVPPRTRGKDIQVATTVGKLSAALSSDVLLASSVSNLSKLLDRALLWLHEQEIITLGRGLTIFRPAMTLQLSPGTQAFTKRHFDPLADHYAEQTIQTHVMAAFAEQGLLSMNRALSLSQDYFSLERDVFLRRWLPNRSADLRRQTMPASWQKIVGSLGNRVQMDIVSDERDQTNVLVLAGPGAGKTKVLVHRIAFLIRVRREDPKGILVLAYNRHAAQEIRVRLRALIGEDATGVNISTCHAFAMRLVGMSFIGRSDMQTTADFDRAIEAATQLLNGDGLTTVEAEAQRDTLVQGYRWILVDEYQDIGPKEYGLVAAIAGRSLDDPDQRLSLFAVGDDDQNIYAFGGASVEYIRKFEADYSAKPAFLVQNYRSTRHIIEAANSVIAPAKERMKTAHPIEIDQGRRTAPKGGALQSLDPVAQGRVQQLKVKGGHKDQAVAAVNELKRLSQLVPDWDWKRAAIIARQWKYLQPVRSYCEDLGIPIDMGNEDSLPLWRLRETQALVEFVRGRLGKMVSSDELSTFIASHPSNNWWCLLQEAIKDLEVDIGARSIPIDEVLEWLAEWLKGARQAPRGLMLLSAHGAKGLEFDHVVVLDGGWDQASKNEDADAPRRLYYVAMTRAKQSLSLIWTGGSNVFAKNGERGDIVERDVFSDPTDLARCHRIYQSVSMRDVDLSYAGRLKPGDPVLSAIAAANIGDSVTLIWSDQRWWIESDTGVRLARLSNAFAPPHGSRFERGEIHACISRTTGDVSPDWQHQLKRETWEIIIPSLTFQ
ncbi:RecQ family ATP-dependent DNA helicase [Hyphomonas sp. WL0036]|uniref:RecQ family ATP-dependent DNA helicase n=1 Tax=Hyphomonas sediminis TaxID=2866160 RepID=UPI001C8028BB|nr:RecQ family ATP-dependent DNA helicase [Hyphomonas sediminis]MBY9068230.1 RecQ family ATP-dependent DNA helicase [Hyphomonas sediminis]